jgi:uncharacterized protein YuzE
MAKVIEEGVLREIFKATSHILKTPIKKMWLDYDEEADVLYISFKRPQKADDSEMLKNGIILRYRKKEVVGITILEASKRR